MNPRLQSTLLLAFTLAVGVVLGAAGSQQVTRLWRLSVEKPYDPSGPKMRRGLPGGFVEKMEEAIAPRDEAQRRAVRGILEATASRNRAEIDAVNAALKARVDSTRIALEPLLDAAQAERLAEAMRGLQPIGPRGRGQGGPPPIGRSAEPEGGRHDEPPPMDARPPR